MKPRFALDLTNDRATLLERTADGWLPLGRAAFDAPDLKHQLGHLRALAEARAPEGFVTKLILPNAQILYFEAAAPGPDRAARRAQIVKALSGRTPYHVDDLVFDFTSGGQRAAVAVITRLTLQEAEAFAAEHGFRPVAFVAIPDAGRFAGEPFFGLSTAAPDLLGADGRYDRDQDPVRILAAPPMAEPEPEHLPAAEAPPPAPEPEGEPVGKTAPEPAMAAPAAEDTPAAITLPPSDADEAPFIEVVEDDAAGMGAPAPLAGIGAGAVGDGTGDALPDKAPADEAPADGGSAAHETDEGALAEAGPAADAPAGAQPQDTTGDPAAPPADPHEETTATAAMGFQSRRQPTAADAGDLPPATDLRAGARLADIVPRLGGMAGLAATPAAAPKPGPGAVQDLAAARDPAPPLTDAGRIARLVARPHATPERKARPSGGGFLAPTVLPAGMDLPRLVAGAVAFLMLAAVLFWAFLSGGETPAPAEIPAPVAEAPATAASETVASTAPVPEQPAAVAAADAGTNAADLAQPSITVAAPAAQAAAPTGEAAAAPNPAGESGVPHPADASALPEPGTLAGDLPLPGQPLPQPFGTLLRYDENGLIMATPEGVVTPGGFTLIAGQPPRRPPARPAGLAPAPEAAIPPATPAPDAPFADPALAGKKPRARPAGLTPPAPATAPVDETGLLPPIAPPVDARHAAMKPKARPAAVAAAAAARRAQDEAVADAAASAARAEAEAAAAAMASASPQAVATSRRPKARTAAAIAAAASAQAAAAAPAAVDSSAVEAALAEAQTAPEPEPAAEPEPPPAEVDEPEPLDGIATLPTTRTVAKKSTYANAIDLGEVNLIGVYGSSSNRRALVRMPNGRFVKVQVGDRLDGGKVAAIGDSELRYVKKGRTITLKIMKNG